MSARFLLQLLVLVASMCLASVALARAWVSGDDARVLAFVVALLFLVGFAWRVLRAAHADWLCYALTGRRMPRKRRS